MATIPKGILSTLSELLQEAGHSKKAATAVARDLVTEVKAGNVDVAAATEAASKGAGVSEAFTVQQRRAAAGMKEGEPPASGFQLKTEVPVERSLVTPAQSRGFTMGSSTTEATPKTLDAEFEVNSSGALVPVTRPGAQSRNIPAGKIAAGVAGVGALGGGLALSGGRQAEEGATTVEAPVSEANAAIAKAKEETKKIMGEAAFQTSDPEKQKIAKIVFPTLNLDKSQVDVTGQFKMLSDRMSQISSELAPDKKDEFNKRLTGLNEQLLAAREKAAKGIAEAKTAAEAQDTRTQWAEVAETIGHALAQLGAGLYGQKTGLNMSGVKFNNRDWSQDYNRIQQQLKGKLDEIEAGLVREEGDIAGLRKETKEEMAQEEARVEQSAAEQKQLLINETKARLQELTRVKDLKNQQSIENFKAATSQAEAAQRKLDSLEIMDVQQKNDLMLTVLRQQGEITKAATTAAEKGDKAGIKSATEKAEALEQGISALYSIKDLKGTEKIKKLEEARDALARAGFPPESSSQILEQSTSGIFIKSFEPEKAATTLRERFTQGQAAAPTAATPTAAVPSPKSAVDFIASKNPQVPRATVIDQLKKANRIPQDYQE